MTNLTYLLLFLFSHEVASDSFVTPWPAIYLAPLTTEFPRQEHWSGLLFPFPGDLPHPGVEPLHWQVDSLPLSHTMLLNFSVFLIELW